MESTPPLSYQCRSCGKVFQSNIALRNHMSSGKCHLHVADEICPRKAEASTNANKMESTPPLSYQCRSCGKIFQSSCALGGHRSSGKCHPHVADGIRPRKAEASPNAHMADVAKKFHCRSCGKGFDTAQAVGGHTSHCSSLTGPKQFHCMYCTKDFPSEPALGGHMRHCKPKRSQNSTSQEKEPKITHEREPSADNSNYKRPKLSTFPVEQGTMPELRNKKASVSTRHEKVSKSSEGYVDEFG